MEEKRRVKFKAAGRTLTILTDESDEQIEQLENTLRDRLDEIAKSSPRLATREGRLDAMILCAAELIGEKNQAEEEARALRKRLEDAEEDGRKLKAEIERLRAASSAAAAVDVMRGRTAQEKRADVLKLLASRKSGVGENPIASQAEADGAKERA